MTIQERSHPSSLLFEGGFRIFFLSAALYAALSMILWICDLTGYSEILGLFSVLPGSLWHAHELIFGVIMAVVAGFLTTAVPVWTGGERIRGTELKILFGLWLLGRLAVFMSELLPLPVVVLIDLSFIPYLAFLIGRQIIQKRLWRNLGFIPMLFFILSGNVLIWGEMLAISNLYANTGIQLSIGFLVLMTVLIGGRVLPVFTSNWLRRANKNNELANSVWLKRLTIVTTLLAVFSGPLNAPQLFQALASIFAAIFIIARLLQWKGWQTLSDPLMWILHLGYLFLGLGFLAEASTHVFIDFPEILANHVLTIGGLGTMVLGMMSRIALGHTGRPLKIASGVALSFWLLIASLIARILPPLAFPDFEDVGLAFAGIAWICAWILYLIYYVPVLTKVRADGKEG
ncbi:MAG: hypothetical protein ACJAYR_000383 [Sneathiella sp.]|jgi:uncharacterized protein involved in response to NO